MPISNSFLSNHRVLLVKNPVFDPNGGIPTLQGSSLFEIVCKSFTSQIQANTSNKTLVQDWPSAKYLEVKPLVYITKIEMPILLDKNGIRTNELSFFNHWLMYMASTFDTIKGTGYDIVSLIIENASINVNENEVLLSLTFRSNFPLGWKPSGFGAATAYSKMLHARKARYYDTFIKFIDYSATTISDNKILGWDNTYGISSFKINYQSEIEEICLSMHEFNSSRTVDSQTLIYPHITDMLNVKNVNYNGEISIFGPEIEEMGVSTQVAWSNNFMPISQDIFTMALSEGAMQIYIGSLNLTDVVVLPDYSNLTPLTFIPTGIMISDASSEFSGGQIYKHNRQFYGVFTDTPKMVLQTGSIINTYLS